jgi:nucleotide-binding universal stress UspA family protein
MHKFMPIMPEGVALSTDFYEPFSEALERAGEGILDEEKKIFETAGVPVETRLVMDQSPEEYAIETVKREAIDVVVVGSKGHHSKMKEVLLGSVSTRILNGSDCDVIVIR